MENAVKPGPEPALILFFAANPLSTTHIAIDREAREIEKRLELKSCTVPLRFKAKWAAQPDDILEALNQERPAVVHFSGHGSRANGIVMHGQDNEQALITTNMLKRLFHVMKDNIRIVVLNACYAEEQARAISEAIDCVIGMRDAISDDAARVFSAAFYRALGHGRDVQNAFEQGLLAIESAGLEEDNVPTLIARAGIQPSAVVLNSRSYATGSTGTSVQAVSRNTSARFLIVFQATLQEFDAQCLTKIVDELQKMTGDFTMRVVRVEEGSVRLIMEMTTDAAQKLSQLLEEGKLIDICGLKVTAARQVVPNQASAIHESPMSVAATDGLDGVAAVFPGGGESTDIEQPASQVDMIVVEDRLSSKRRATLRAMMSQYGGMIFDFVARIVKDEALAQDVWQQVFVEAYRNLPETQPVSVSGDVSVQVWLFDIVMRRSRNALKAKQAQDEMRQDSPGDHRTMYANQDSPGELLEQDELYAALQSCLEELKPEMQAGMMLGFEDDLSYIHTETTTLQVRVTKALALLRRCLKKKGWEF